MIISLECFRLGGRLGHAYSFRASPYARKAFFKMINQLNENLTFIIEVRIVCSRSLHFITLLSFVGSILLFLCFPKEKVTKRKGKPKHAACARAGAPPRLGWAYAHRFV
jgi:hypothetical protein